MNRFFTLLLAASCLTAVGQTDYVPDSVLEEGGWELVLEREGQQYWLFDEDREWEDARAMCAEFGAYLYWPNSLEEHLDVWASVPNGNDGVHYWTAIHQDFSQVVCDSEEGWAGPNGEPQTFFHWDDGQPNNGDGESVVQFEWSDWGATWNDAPGQECDGNDQCSCRMSRVILERTSLMEGCVDQNACNFNPDADVEDGSCHFLCQYCKEGTVWDEAIQGCVVANPSDSNLDGCVQLNDLLDLLSAYGDCGAEESAWQCGDPLEYQGYDYETVQIGDQCWFAENLRAENYTDGSSIPLHSIVNPVSGPDPNYRCFYDDDPENGVENGMLYSWYASIDSRGVCPSGWHLPSLTDFEDLTNVVGGASNAGSVLKVQPPMWNGSDEYGFSALPSGYFNWVNAPYSSDPLYFFMGSYAYFWSSVSSGSNSAYYMILWNNENYASLLPSNGNFAEDAMSIRCIKDTE